MAGTFTYVPPPWHRPRWVRRDYHGERNDAYERRLSEWGQSDFNNYMSRGDYTSQRSVPNPQYEKLVRLSRANMASQEFVRRQLQKPNLTEDEVFRLLERLKVLESRGRALRKLRIREPAWLTVAPEPLRDAQEVYGFNGYRINQ